MHIESPKRQLKKSDQEVFDFLSNVSNFEKLMPENTEKFEVLGPDKFVFALKGMPEIVLKKKGEHPNSKVIFGAASDKLPFTLTADIRSLAQDASEVTLSFEGEFNAMMAMMVKSPITNFISTLSDNLDRI